MTTRILIADQSEARIYDWERPSRSLQLVVELAHPEARLHDRDLKSDRPGRVFDHAPTAGQRRGATAHHATGGEHSPRQHEAEGFARRIAHVLEAAHQQRQYAHLVIMAAPAFLGLLRGALPKAVGATIVAEVPKDLLHGPESAILEHLPQ
jgi:protein required for attachment to host cells